MPRMSPDDRREAIVEAARRVMARQGIAATTVRDIATELGTSGGLIHHYVDSMDSLLAEAFAREADDDLAATRAAVATGATPTRQLALMVDSYGRGGMQLWLDAWAEAARRPALRRTTQRVNRAWQRMLRDIIERGLAAGTMSTDDAEAASWRVLAALDGLALQAVAHPGAITAGRARRWSRRAAERELGLAPGELGA